MARTVAAGSASFSVTVWCTNSFAIGAYFWLFLRIDSSAPHWARVMTGGSAALGFGFEVVVVVDEPPVPRVVVVVDDDVDEVAASAVRRPSPPSDWGAVVEVVDDDDAYGNVVEEPAGV